jgi:thiamine biosynthesis lipoprotein
MASELDYRFKAMGSEVRLLIGDPLLPNAPTPLEAADRERAFVLDFSNRLSRFVEDSELSAFNRDGAQAVVTGEILRAAVGAGLWAAERSGGLVDPTLVGALERSGYDRSLKDAAPASLEEALAVAPASRPARPDPREGWREWRIDDDAGVIVRPPGARFDTGGTGKGLCADAIALHLGGYTRFVADCGGDIAVGGIGLQFEPYMIEIEHPLTHESLGAVGVTGGGIATSGLNVRIWRRPDGGFAHHLLDPSTGQPVWSGLIGATAIGDSALEAETLSKMALLLGPDGARQVLAEQGGLIVHDSGRVEAIGPLRDALVTGSRLPAPPARRAAAPRPAAPAR